MPSHLLKSSPVDHTPPVVVLPPNIVEIELDTGMEHVDIHHEFPVIYQEEDPNATLNVDTQSSSNVQIVSTEQTPLDKEILQTPTKGGKRSKQLKRSIKKLEKYETGKNGEAFKTPVSRKSFKQPEVKKLPEALFKIIEDYSLDDAPSRPNNAYIRYIERTPEELADIVEYDLDEEDFEWLKIINEQREKDGLQAVQPEVMEFIMDKLEKESYFQMQSSGMEQGPIIDDDAVCCICMDGECQNANAILFCDMCNLAVHQECYGVPYIPEGQWLCRRCLLSPSIAVDCVLCPNKGGAFKETECKRWAHVVCAIWIPEVCFSNTVFLEPIDNVGSIPQARWRLQCFICKQKNKGACIQCYKSNCYTAFHVTCAQQAGLCMRMETVRLSTGVTVKKTAWCDLHAPPDFIAERDSGSSTARQKLKQIRKMLAEKRCAPPVLSIPTIPTDKMTQISSAVSFTRKKEFIKILTSYWKLKRMSRNGVPLLRRLQVASNTSSVKSSRKLDSSQVESTMQNYAEIMRLRQDLERGRLLCELTRKREKLKRENIYTTCHEWDMRIQPFNYFLSSIVDDLASKDSQSIFTQPVDTEQVPDYLTVVTNPMDLSTMRKKIFEFEYQRIEDLEMDFRLMINNCLLYNSPDTVFYRFALKMQEYGGIVFREAKRKFELIGFVGDSGIMTREPPPQYLEQPDIVDDAKLVMEIDTFLNDRSRYDLTYEEHMHQLELNLDKSVNLNHPVSRKKRFIRIKNEIVRLKRRKRMIESGGSYGRRSVAGDASSVDEDEVAPSPSIFSVDTVESSDAGEEGDGASTTYPSSSTYVSVLRRRLRSTDMNVEPPLQMQQSMSQSLRVSRRLSRSSESTMPAPQPQTVSIHVPPDATLISGVNMGLPLALSERLGGPRRRGRPPKALSQRGRGRRLGIPSTGSPSPLRQRSIQGSSMRGRGLRGRPGRPRGRRMARPVRRSDRVVKQQQQQQQQQQLAQQQHSTSPGKESQGESQRELRRGSPQARNTSPKASYQSGIGSRNTSPTHSTSSHKVRNVSPVIMGIPTKSQIRIGTNRQPGPILSAPLLKPQQPVRTGLKLVSSPKLKPVRSLGIIRQGESSPISPPKIRPVRERAVKMLQKNSPSLPQNNVSPKSMEAAAKSIIFEERPARKAGTVGGGGAGGVSKPPKLKRIRGASPNVSTRGAITNQVVRRHPSVGKGSSVTFEMFNNSNAATTTSAMVATASSGSSNASPRKIKGPAAAVGRRKKSVGEMNGPSASYVGLSAEEIEKRKLLFPPTNGLPMVASSSSSNRQLTPSTTTPVKKRGPRPKRHTVAGAPSPAPNPTAGGAYSSNSSMIIPNSTGSFYHSPSGAHLKKMDSFSVYRSGGDHDINSCSEAESGNEDDDEIEEEEDEEEDDDEEEEEEEEEDDEDDEEEDEEEEDAGKSISASDDEDEEDDDEDAEKKMKKPGAKEGDDEEEEESEDGNSSGEGEGQGEDDDSSDSDNSSDSDSDSSSSSSSSLSSTNSGTSTASSSSSITSPRHMHPSRGSKLRKRRRSSSTHRQPQAQLLSISTNPQRHHLPTSTATSGNGSNNNNLNPQQPSREGGGGGSTSISTSGNRTVVPQQLASPSMSYNNNNNNNNVLCSNKEIEKDRSSSSSSTNNHGPGGNGDAGAQHPQASGSSSCSTAASAGVRVDTVPSVSNGLNVSNGSSSSSSSRVHK